VYVFLSYFHFFVKLCVLHVSMLCVLTLSSMHIVWRASIACVFSISFDLQLRWIRILLTYFFLKHVFSQQRLEWPYIPLCGSVGWPVTYKMCCVFLYIYIEQLIIHVASHSIPQGIVIIKHSVKANKGSTIPYERKHNALKI
jgi:hypothetical protein